MLLKTAPNAGSSHTRVSSFKTTGLCRFTGCLKPVSVHWVPFHTKAALRCQSVPKANSARRSTFAFLAVDHMATWKCSRHHSRNGDIFGRWYTFTPPWLASGRRVTPGGAGPRTRSRRKPLTSRIRSFVRELSCRTLALGTLTRARTPMASAASGVAAATSKHSFARGCSRCERCSRSASSSSPFTSCPGLASLLEISCENAQSSPFL